MAQKSRTNFMLNVATSIVLMLFTLTACLPGAATEDGNSKDHTTETNTYQHESSQEPFVLENVDETENGYILRGIFLDSIGLPKSATMYGNFQPRDWWKITDANGQNVDFDIPESLAWGNHDRYYFPWAIELKSRQYNWPLTIAFEAVTYTLPVKGEFDFDTGSNPQDGQTWDLNLAVEVGETLVQINSISRTENGYIIDVAGDFEMINISSLSKEPNGVEFEVLDNGHKRLRLVYDSEAPAGLLTFELSSPVLKLDGPWEMQWQPGGDAISPLTETMLSPDVSEVNP